MAGFSAVLVSRSGLVLHCKQPRCQFASAADIDLLEDRFQVILDRVLRNVQPPCNLLG